ncbi:hypothetical protein, partial [Falsiroseomonas selenitidurans]
MTAYRIGTAERAALLAGEPAVIAAPGMEGLAGLPVAVLLPVQGVLRRAGGSGPAAALPPAPRPLALLAPDAEQAARLAQGLPPGWQEGLPRILGAAPLAPLAACLARALAAAEAARGAA